MRVFVKQKLMLRFRKRKFVMLLFWLGSFLSPKGQGFLKELQPFSWKARYTLA